MSDLYFKPEGNETRLAVAWGTTPAPDGVVGSQVEVAVDDQEWVEELEVDKTASDGWFLYSVGTGDSRRPITPESTYRARVRWKLSDGSTTPWSKERTVEAEP